MSQLCHRFVRGVQFKGPRRKAIIRDAVEVHDGNCRIHAFWDSFPDDYYSMDCSLGNSVSYYLSLSRIVIIIIINNIMYVEVNISGGILCLSVAPQAQFRCWSGSSFGWQ